MISLQEYKIDNNKKMYRILDDKIFVESPVYERIFPKLYSEINEQYAKSENHWYYLSDVAYKQYQQHKLGLVYTN